MQLAGFMKLSLLDYPGELACTVFTKGCNFRCPFCHNASIVLPEEEFMAGDREEYKAGGTDLLSIAVEQKNMGEHQQAVRSENGVSASEFYDFLKSRQGKLTGVCISGGEPMLQPDLKEMIVTIRKLGFPVKLDTNGSFPEKLEEFLAEHLLDYVAMDVKNSPLRYGETIGHAEYPSDSLIRNIDRSIRLLKSSGIPHEFRTTIVEEYHTEDAMTEIAKWLEGDSKYYLQQFAASEQIIGSPDKLHALSRERMERLADCVRPYVPKVELRGI